MFDLQLLSPTFASLQVERAIISESGTVGSGVETTPSLTPFTCSSSLIAFYFCVCKMDTPTDSLQKLQLSVEPKEATPENKTKATRVFKKQKGIYGNIDLS